MPERESGMDRQDRSLQNVRRRGGVVKINGKMKTERVCLAGEIDKEWSRADKIATTAYEKGKKTAAENLAKCKSRQKKKARRCAGQWAEIG